MLRMMAEKEIAKGLATVLARIATASEKRSQEHQWVQPRLVAVSKTKSVDLIRAAYLAGQRHFGENYDTEITQKSAHPTILENCPDIRWHYVGRIQTNKIKKILASPGLFMVETVHSVKAADMMNTTWGRLLQQPAAAAGEASDATDDSSLSEAAAKLTLADKVTDAVTVTVTEAGDQKPVSSREGPLRVMVQVNTSDETNKAGCSSEEVCALVEHVMRRCPHLQFTGLMTIGSVNHDLSTGPNPDFMKLIGCKEEVCQRLKLSKEEVELSMGMSADFEHAIELGSTNVRVGSIIFGARDYTKQAPATT